MKKAVKVTKMNLNGFFDMSDMQVIHALHREFFGIIIFMLAKVIQRAYI